MLEKFASSLSPVSPAELQEDANKHSLPFMAAA